METLPRRPAAAALYSTMSASGRCCQDGRYVPHPGKQGRSAQMFLNATEMCAEANIISIYSFAQATK